MRVGLIGHGAIAHQIINRSKADDSKFSVVGVLDKNDSREPDGPTVSTDFDAFMATDPDLVVECAGHEAVHLFAKPVLATGKELIVVSIGSLADPHLREELTRAAQSTAGRVLLPAGAVAGIDGLAAARTEGLDTVTLTSRKAPMAWGGAPGVEGIDLAAIDRPTPIFEGHAGDAARLFPKNANVAATVALAGIGFEDTQVTLIAEPDLPVNSHRIDATGLFGRMTVEMFNNTSPDNPKTSALTAMSIVRLINNETSGISI